MIPLRWLVFATCVATAVSCANSRVAGDPDADVLADSAVDLDPADAEIDDTPVDSAGLDSAVADGPDQEIDAAAIDARPVDAQPVDAAIDASICPTQPCDLHAQCGCTSPLVCDLDFSDLVGTQCRAVTAGGTETSTCTSTTQCAAGHVCVPSGSGSRCMKYCDEDSDCGQPRGDCVIQLATDQGDIPGATTCSANCNPANSAAGGCPSGWKCGLFTINNALTGNVDRDIVECATAGTGTQGSPCTSDAMCAANYVCTTGDVCRRVCNRTSGGNECASISGTTCGGFAPSLTIGGTEYGACF